MKTVYERYGDHCIIREIIICEENVVIIITRYIGGDTPNQDTDIKTEQFPSAPDARREYYELCKEKKSKKEIKI